MIIEKILFNFKLNYRHRRYFFCKNSKFIYSKSNFEKWGSDDGIIHTTPLFNIIARSIRQAIMGGRAPYYNIEDRELNK